MFWRGEDRERERVEGVDELTRVELDMTQLGGTAQVTHWVSTRWGVMVAGSVFAEWSELAF